ncbi:MAG: adenosine-specific kinase [Candidatus Thermoplasmatota archaeon]|nr:adenosine-specific kinase [Candidatus Thermoplasmatota archaeon]
METIFETVDLTVPSGSNIILGYSHFIKTVEDLMEIVNTTIGNCRYGIAFSEASGERLIRFEGNDSKLIEHAVENLKKIASGHTFIIIMKDAYPISILNQIKLCQEVGTVFAATANPIKVILAKSQNGNGVMGVIDGFSPLGVEAEKDKINRRELLRKIGYKS